MVQELQDVLQDTFGYSQFRGPQEAIIEHVRKGNDAVVIMPTGGGKSLCYQIPALLMKGLTIVVSPLIALMEDQVLALQQNGVVARSLHSGKSYDQKREIQHLLEKGELNLLYMAPESLLQDKFLEYARKHLQVALFAIDEAHCVSVWGNDFRPEYVRLSVLKNIFPNVPIIALTATADTATQTDIAQKLQIPNAQKFISSFERANITIYAQPGRNRVQQIMDFLESNKGESGIIYCLSRNGTETLAKKIIAEGHPAAAYHAGMNYQVRQQVQQDFQEDRTRIVCATIAFGMGIDKHNVRYVIHYNMPKNVEGFYQEIGRAGRDGMAAQSLLFYSWADYLQLRKFVEEGNADDTFKKVQLAKLERMWQFAESASCRTNMILNYFGEYREKACGHCDNCLHPRSFFDGSILAQKALSAIIRAKQQLPISAIIDLLKGQAKSEIVKLGLHQCPTFGVGRELPYIHWKEYIQQMINQGLISVDFTDRYKLKITPLSQAVLKGDTPVKLTEYVPPKQKQPAPRVSKKKKLRSELWQRLVDWRAHLASLRKLPAQMILSDATLHEVVQKRPAHVEDLKEIDGFGRVKIEELGEYILEIIRKYLLEQKHVKNVKGSTYLKTLELYKDGMAVDDIAQERKLNPITIYSHLATLYEKGEDIDLEKFISDEIVQAVRKQWIALDHTDSLKDLRAATNYDYMYYQVRLALAVIKKNEKKQR